MKFPSILILTLIGLTLSSCNRGDLTYSGNWRMQSYSADGTKTFQNQGMTESYDFTERSASENAFLELNPASSSFQLNGQYFLYVNEGGNEQSYEVTLGARGTYSDGNDQITFTYDTGETETFDVIEFSNDRFVLNRSNTETRAEGGLIINVEEVVTIIYGR